MSRRWRRLIAAGTGVVCVSCAANSPARTGPSSWEPPQAVLPYDSAPVLVNEEEVSLEMRQAYPPELHEAGIGGRVEVWVRVNDEGNARSRRIRTSSGHDALDRAAVDVVRMLRFAPAKNLGIPTGVWVSQPITFAVEPRAAG